MSKLMDAESSTLVLVDYQERLLPVIDRCDEILNEALKLAVAAQWLEVPVLATEQNPNGLGPTWEGLRQHCASTVEKMHFDACADGLLDHLVGPAGAEVVLAGCEAHVCVLQTGLGLLRAGKRLVVVANACGSRFEPDHRLAMDRLARAGAQIVSTEMVLFEWLRSAKHPVFREVLNIVK